MEFGSCVWWLGQVVIIVGVVWRKREDGDGCPPKREDQGGGARLLWVRVTGDGGGSLFRERVERLREGFKSERIR